MFSVPGFGSTGYFGTGRYQSFGGTGYFGTGRYQNLGGTGYSVPLGTRYYPVLPGSGTSTGQTLLTG